MSKVNFYFLFKLPTSSSYLAGVAISHARRGVWRADPVRPVTRGAVTITNHKVPNAAPPVRRGQELLDQSLRDLYIDVHVR